MTTYLLPTVEEEIAIFVTMTACQLEYKCISIIAIKLTKPECTR